MDSNASVSVNFPHCHCESTQDHSQGVAPCRSSDHWSYALSQVRKSVFNSTSTAIYSPAQHLLEYEKLLKRERNEPEPQKYFGAYNYDFNEEPLSTKDIFSYRQHRSEHLLIRMIHNFSLYEFNHSFVRLARGVFLVQKWECSEPVDFPFPTAVESEYDYNSRKDSIAPIDTFSFNDLFNDMVSQTKQQQQKQQENPRSFIPYTYTMGVRYTNPYNNMRDILVRGKIPLWCQTLFITECMRFLPILPGSTVNGLLPFANDMEFKFTTPIVEKGRSKVVEPYPELIVLFERFAMELSDPQMMLENIDAYGNTWEDRHNAILSGVLFCDIPDETALIITTLANEWATAQGLSLQ